MGGNQETRILAIDRGSTVVRNNCLNLVCNCQTNNWFFSSSAHEQTKWTSLSADSFGYAGCAVNFNVHVNII
jgi:hypothetical protein